MKTGIPVMPGQAGGRRALSARGIATHAQYFYLLLTVLLIAHVIGCGYLRRPPPNGKISVQVVSWKLVKKLAEPDAGLSGHKVSILNPADRAVIASGITDGSGLVAFDVPQGTYMLVGASDEPQSVQVQAGRTVNLKLVVH
jgi:hypothetical protein